MRTETITQCDTLVIRRLVLEPGEATPWHTDACRRFSVVVRGERLRIEFRDAADHPVVAVEPGSVGWDQPEARIHRAWNIGATAYEEVVTFFLDQPEMNPQSLHRDL